MKQTLWLLALVGCVDLEPAPGPPVELELVGDLDVVTYHHREQYPTAVGGTQTFHLHYAGGVPGIAGPVFDLPYTVVVADDRLRIEDRRDTSLTIRGVAPGHSTLRFLYMNGSLIDELQLSVAEIQKIVLDPMVSELLPRDVYWPTDRSVAWAPGEHTFAVGLYAGIGRLADSSMQIALTGAERTGLDKLHVPARGLARIRSR